MTRPGLAILLMGILLLSACSTVSQRAGIEPEFQENVYVDLSAIPFYASSSQESSQSALATMLRWAAIDIKPEELHYLKKYADNHHQLQPVIARVSKKYHRIPYRLETNHQAIVEEVMAGHPVMVAHNKGVSWFSHIEYSLVVGYEANSGSFLLRTHNNEEQTIALNDFLSQWNEAESWAMVVLPGDQLPATASKEQFLEKVVEMEEVGAYDVALEAYLGALDKWGAHPTTLHGIGKILIEAGQLGEAEYIYQSLIEHDNNYREAYRLLAQIQLLQDKPVASFRTITKAMKQFDESEKQYKHILKMIDKKLRTHTI